MAELNASPAPVLEAPAPARGREARALDRSLVQGIAWTSGIRWSGQLLTWLSTLIVARLLSPSDYGLVGMAGLYLGLIQMLSEFGVGASVIVLRDLDRVQVAQLNSVALVFGLVGFLASCLVATPLAHFFHSPQLVGVVILLSGTFVISAFQVIPSSLLQRELRFRLVSVIGGVQAVGTAAVTLTLATMHFGYWALVGGSLAGALISTVLTLTFRRHGFGFPRIQTLLPALSFSRNIILSRLCWFSYSNADFLVIGRLFGQAALGGYTFGWTISNMVIDKITAMIGSVTPGIFSVVQNDLAELRRYLLAITEGLALVTFPATVGLALVADHFVLFALGTKWQGAIAPLRFLSLCATLRSITPMLPQVLNVVGESAFVMKNAILSAIAMPLSFLAFSRWGTTGIAVAWLIVYPPVILPTFWRTFTRTQLTASAYFRALWPALSSTAAMAVAVLLVRWWSRGLPSLPGRLAAEVAVGALAYCAAMLTMHAGRLGAMRRTVALMRG